MPYEQKCGGAHPCCMILLLDQSGSMSEPFGGSQPGKSSRRCDMVATIVNGFLAELIDLNTVNGEVRPRCDVAVLGYGGESVRSLLPPALAHKEFVTLQELADNPARIEMRETEEVVEEVNEIGRIERKTVAVPNYFSIWVEPVADGATPMRVALAEATRLASGWAATHPSFYPPVIVNITDGAATDCGDNESTIRPALEGAAHELTSVATSDGNVLLYNCHITGAVTPPIDYPVTEPAVPPTKEEPWLPWLARTLFAISSTLPDTAITQINGTLAKAGKAPLSSGARGFIFNGNAVSVVQLLTFASLRVSAIDMTK